MRSRGRKESDQNKSIKIKLSGIFRRVERIMRIVKEIK